MAAPMPCCISPVLAPVRARAAGASAADLRAYETPGGAPAGPPSRVMRSGVGSGRHGRPATAAPPCAALCIVRWPWLAKPRPLAAAAPDAALLPPLSAPPPPLSTAVRPAFPGCRRPVRPPGAGGRGQGAASARRSAGHPGCSGLSRPRCCALGALPGVPPGVPGSAGSHRPWPLARLDLCVTLVDKAGDMRPGEHAAWHTTGAARRLQGAGHGATSGSTRTGPSTSDACAGRGAPTIRSRTSSTIRCRPSRRGRAPEAWRLKTCGGAWPCAALAARRGAVRAHLASPCAARCRMLRQGAAAKRPTPAGGADAGRVRRAVRAAAPGTTTGARRRRGGRDAGRVRRAVRAVALGGTESPVMHSGRTGPLGARWRGSCGLWRAPRHPWPCAPARRLGSHAAVARRPCELLRPRFASI